MYSYEEFRKKENEEYGKLVEKVFGITPEQAKKKLVNLYKSLGIYGLASENEFDSVEYVYHALKNPEILEQYAKHKERYGGTPKMYFAEIRY